MNLYCSECPGKTSLLFINSLTTWLISFIGTVSVFFDLICLAVVFIQGILSYQEMCNARLLIVFQDEPAHTLWLRNGVTQNVTWLLRKILWCPSTSGVNMQVMFSSSSNEPARQSVSGPLLTGRLGSQNVASTDRVFHLWPSSARQGQTARSSGENPNASLWPSLEGPRVCGTYLGKAGMLKVGAFSVCYIHTCCALYLFLSLSTIQLPSFHLPFIHPRSQTAPAVWCESAPEQSWRRWSSICTWESSQGAEPAGTAAARQAPGPGEPAVRLWGRTEGLGGGRLWRQWSEEKSQLPGILPVEKVL